MRLSLVIPCYNEAANLPPLIDRIKQSITLPDVEVILVDNGSTDDTAIVLNELLRDLPTLRSFRVPINRGYGFGILSGLAEAKGKFVGWTHADMQTDPADALRGLELITASVDPHFLFVKGKRFGRPASDAAFTFAMSVFETALLRTALWDINAQPTIFPRHLFESWRDPPHDFSLDLYAYYSAKTAGYAVARFPVQFGDRLHGNSHWNINWSAKAKFIRRTLEFSFRLKKDLG